MRANKLFKRQKAENGAGRTVKVKHLLLPEEVVEDLKVFKSCYELCLSTEKEKDGTPKIIRVTYEQMLRRWMDNIGRFDPDVVKMFNHIKEYQANEQGNMAAKLGLSPEEYQANWDAFDPSDVENKPWELRYRFEKDGEEVEALPGVYTPFYAKINGRNVGMKDMLADEWTLRNENGDELDFEEAMKICVLIKEHQKKD